MQNYFSIEQIRVKAIAGSACTLFLALLLAVVPAALCQVLYGVLTGTVTDATGASVTNATVTVRNQSNGETRTIQTNSSGNYTVRDLLAGQYTVAVPAAGTFGGYTQQNVAIDVNKEVRVNVTLQSASVNSEITVSTGPPLLQTESAEVNHEISQAEVSELPITSSQGRNFQALYALIPGVSPPAEQNSTASNPARAVAVNVNGVANVSNTTRIDGAVNTYGWLPYIIAYVPPADAIGNVNIVTNSFNAEQGTAGGSSINVQIKSGTSHLHGSLWEYNQLFNTNARGYTATAAQQPRVPKNIFNQMGGSIGGPIYIPHLLTGKDKLFFFVDFERTTRRQTISGTQTIPTTALINGDFSSVANLATVNGTNQSTVLYDPATGNPDGTGRLTFLQEYGVNAIPASRISPQAAKMLSYLAPLSASISGGTPNYAGGLAQDYYGAGIAAYNREALDAKVNYNATDRTSFFGRYSFSPDAVSDPQQLGAAGGGTFDGGQPGAATGRIQNVGLGASHVITPNLVVDANFGYTRQRTGAQSALDQTLGNFGLNVLGIPGTNGPNILQEGQPVFAFSNGFSSLGNSNGSNPFQFRDNQYTGNVNVSYTKGKHAMKYGGEYYHFALNHFQPTSGSGINNPRGGFMFTGNQTTLNGGKAATIYNSLADFLLGNPNAVAKATQIFAPNSLRWSAFSFYAQDQWQLTRKLTVNFGARYEYYPPPTRDHEGIFRFDPSLPLAANVIAGGVNGNSNGAGTNVGKGLVVPRLGIAYRITEKTVFRAGGGITQDPDNFRFLRDTFPIDVAQNFSAPNTYGIATDTTQNTATGGLPLTLAVGIPGYVQPNFSSGSLSLPVNQSTTTLPQNFRRGYIESWNMFLQQDLGGQFVMNVGYVGTHEVRQITSVDINPAPIPDSTTVCMANGTYNPSSPYYVAGAKNTCSFNANLLFNVQHCNATTGATCYNNTGVGSGLPIFSSNYNGLQTELTRRAGRLAQFGLVYTWSHAFDFADNSTYNGISFASPQYFSRNRATAGYDRTNNIQFWAIYNVPFGAGKQYLTQGIGSKLLGGFQFNTTISHFSGTPFSVSPTSNTLNAPGNTNFANLIGPYRVLNGHAQTASSPVSGGLAYFDPTSFANPTGLNFGNTHRNQFRGPGQTQVNASLFRSFHVYRESAFQLRFEAFNLLNHALLNTPNVTVGGGTFGYITSFGGSRALQFSGRFNF